MIHFLDSVKRFSILILLNYSLLIGIGNCKDIVEENCETTCRFSIQCTEKNQKLTLSDTEKQNAKIYCVQGCTMMHNEIQQCFEDTYPSCEGFQKCVIQSGILE